MKKFFAFIFAVTLALIGLIGASTVASADELACGPAWTETIKHDAVADTFKDIENPDYKAEYTIDHDAIADTFKEIVNPDYIPGSTVEHPAIIENQLITPAVPEVKETSHIEYEWKWWGEKDHGTKVWSATQPTERLNDVKYPWYEGGGYGDWRKTGNSKKVIDQAYVPGKPAVWGPVVVKGAWTEVIPAVGTPTLTVVDVPGTDAWTETVPAEGEPTLTVIDVPGTDAWTETIEHEAVACPVDPTDDPTDDPTTVPVIDPTDGPTTVPVSDPAPTVAPVASDPAPVAKVTKAAPAKTLAETGSSEVIRWVLLAGLLVAGGVALVAARKRKSL